MWSVGFISCSTLQGRIRLGLSYRRNDWWVRIYYWALALLLDGEIFRTIALCVVALPIVPGSLLNSGRTSHIRVRNNVKLSGTTSPWVWDFWYSACSHWSRDSAESIVRCIWKFAGGSARGIGGGCRCAHPGMNRIKSPACRCDTVGDGKCAIHKIGTYRANIRWSSCADDKVVALVRNKRVSTIETEIPNVHGLEWWGLDRGDNQRGSNEATKKRLESHFWLGWERYSTVNAVVDGRRMTSYL